MEEGSNMQSYGLPLYASAWVPYKHILLASSRDQKQDQSVDDAPPDRSDYLLLAGGGGEGQSGIRNALVLVEFDFESNSLSRNPVNELSTDSEVPYRMAVHPHGDGIICALPKGCRLFEWDTVEDRIAGVRVSQKVLAELEDVGQQLALVFNNDGSMLAVGGEDGKLRVFKWPSMENILDKDQAHSSVKDLDFSPDGKLLVSLGDSGPCRVWDLTSSTAVASLAKENGERFGFCRFCQLHDGSLVLYVTAVTGQGGNILKWNTTSWNKMGSKQVVRDSINAFNLSADGKLLAVGTGEGDVFILDSLTMRVQMVVRKAHLGFVTALTFSHDSRGIVSVSMDSSARVSRIDLKKSGLSLWVVLLVLLLAIAMSLWKNRDLVLQKVASFNAYM